LLLFRLAKAVQPSLVGTIAMETAGAQSRNDFNFTLNIQANSPLEIFFFAMPNLKLGSLPL
jgi:hypothetical protein